LKNQTLKNEVRGILEQTLNYSRSTRFCDKLSDLNFIETHVLRVLGKYASGRDYLQTLEDDLENDRIARATYFSSLHSERRRDMIGECENALYKTLGVEMALENVDHFRKFPELDEYDISSFDGHYRKHACHAPRDDKGKYRATGGIFGLNMRNGLMQSLVTTDFTVSKTNEIKAFKKRFGASFIGKRKMICLLDMAYWDGPYWQEVKALKQNGIYVITLMKDNLRPTKEVAQEFDRNHPYNFGVESVSEVTFRSGASSTKIVYRDPETKKKYVYLTTISKIEPGLVAHLYLHRWKIEKVFDVFKNKLYEKKTWADGEVSADIQASAVAMAYNLLLRKQEIALADEGVFEIKLEEKQKKAIAKRVDRAEKKGRKVHPLVLIPHKFFQMSAQYIRYFRNNLRSTSLWKDLIPGFEKTMACYL
jgi:hypothetical protein